MANNITGASLAPIYNRLNQAPQYHPVEAETFSDWAIEAGDIVTISRGDDSYESPVHSTTMTWKGAPKVNINASGNEKREPVAKIGKRKYNSGSGGYRNSHEMYYFAVTAEGLFHEVYDSDGRFSRLQNTVEGLRHEVYDTDGRFSLLQNTVDGLHHEVYDTNGRFSTLQNTVNGLYHEVYDTNGRFSTLRNTVNGLYHEVYDTNGRFGTLQNTVNGLYHEVYDTNGRFSTLRNTVNGLYHEVYDTNGRFSTLQNTVNGLYHEVYDTNGRYSTLKNTVDGLYHEVYDTNGKFSRLQNTVNGLYHEVYDTNGRFSTLRNTVNGLYHEVYDTNGSFSVLRNEVDGLYSEVYDSGTGITSRIESLGNRISLVVTDGSNPSIKPASIVTAINESGSQVVLSADHVQISGTTKINDVFTVSGNSLLIKGGAMFGTSDSYSLISGQNITASYYSVRGSGYVRFSGSGSSEYYDLTSDVVKTMIKKAEVDGNTLKLTPVSGEIITFSKAVTSIGYAWNSGKLTVTAYPQGYSTQLLGVAAAGSWDSTNPNQYNGRIRYYEGSDDETQYNTGATFTVNAQSRYNNGWKAAEDELVWPTSNTSTASMTITHPSSNVGQTASHVYTVSVDSDYAYVKNAANTVVARVANSVTHNIGITVNSGSAIAGTQEGAQFISGCTQIFSSMTLRGHASGRYYKFTVSCGGTTKNYYFTVYT